MPKQGPTAWCVLLALTVAGCASPVQELAGPSHAQPLDVPSPYDARYVTTTDRAGALQPFILFRPPHPVASVILFTGGDGLAQVSTQGIRRTKNFLIRTRFEWLGHGFLVAIVDPPSDRSSLYGFRITRAHALDIKGVIAYLRQQAPVPVWLVGTSYGTVSAIKVADWLADGGGPDGVVLTSSLFVASRFGESVLRADPERIRVPLLVVHNRSDRCPATPYFMAEGFVERMKHGAPAALITFEGGGPTSGDYCEPFDYHGFPGIEGQVVDAISAWIVAHPPK